MLTLIRHTTAYAGGLAAALGLAEGAAWGWLTQVPEDVPYRPFKCGVWAATTWALIVAISAIPIAALVAALTRQADEARRAAAARALGIVWPLLLMGGITLNRELLPSLLSPVSIAANAAFVAALVLMAWLVARRPGAPPSGTAAWLGRTGPWLLIAAAAVHGLIWRLERREQHALSLTAYARLHAGDEAADAARADRARLITRAPLAPATGDSPLPADTNVLIILVDALRPDHMGCYGHVRDTTPNIDRLAAKAVVFENAICQKASTSPSCASLYTAVYPHTHGIIKPGEWLDDSFVTIAEHLRARGFATAQVANNNCVSRDHNFAQGFASAEQPSPGEAEGLTDAALRRLDGLAAAPGPWFLYVHYLDPHEPFKPPPPYHRMFVGDALYGQSASAALRIVDSLDSYGHIREKMAIGDTEAERTNPAYYIAEYDAEIRYVDDHLPRLIQRLDQLGQRDRTLIIITADHGESLGEHGWWFEHGVNAYQDVARVPLILYHTGLKPRRITCPVELFSVMPTVLDLLGMPKPPGIEAPSLADLATANGPATDRHRFAFIEGRGAEPLCRAVVAPEYKLIWNWPPCSMRRAWSLSMLLRPRQRPKLWHLAIGHLRTPVWELYNLNDDPHEQRNVVDQHPETAADLKRVLFAWVASAPRDQRQWAQANAERLSEEALEKLRSLGYVE